MPLINTSVPNLIQGVSQQPDATRFDGQCEEQENALSSVAEGLKKRPNTRHVARLLQSAIDANSFVHFIDRNDSEKYVIIHDGICLKAWNILSGTEATINGATGGYTPASGAYLDVSKANEELKALTVADNTFILNTEKVVSEGTATSTSLDKDAVTAFLQGDYEKRYEIEIGRSNKPKVIFNWQLWSNGDGKLVSFNIVSSGHGVQSFQYLMGNGQDTGFVPTFDSEGRMTGGTLTTSTSYRWPAWKLAGRSVSIVYKAGVTEIDESHHARMVLTSGSATTGKNADTNILAQNMVRLASVSGLTVSTILGMTGSLSKTSSTVVSNFDTTSVGHVIRHKWKGGTLGPDFTIRAYDPLGGSGMSTVYKEVDSISSLPLICPDGFKVKIVGNADISQDDYYVEFTTTDDSVMGHGTWSETIGPNVKLGLDNATMPMTLISTGLNSFSLETINYTERTAGDEESNPAPSFVNKKINNISFFKNRLGFLTDDSVIFSEAGYYFNFYRNTVSNLLDSAPIDVNVSSTRVTKLSAALGFQENLLIFGDNAQFIMKGGEILTSKTVSINAVTTFNFEDKVDPLPLGSYVYFPFTRGSYSGLREFTVNANNDTYDASEITEHTPAYVPSDAIIMKGTTSEDIIVLVSKNETDAIYVYNYFWNNNQKVLSAWSKFTFTGEIRGMEFIDSTLYVVITNNGETNLVEMPLESGLTDAAGYVTHLDSRIANTVPNGSSTITLPYTPADNSVEVYTTDGLALNCTNSGATVTLAQAASGNTDVWVGIPYTMKYTFSEQLFKAKAGNGKSPSNAANMRIRNGSIYHADSAYYKVKVTPEGRATYENIFTTGTSTPLALNSHFYRFPVFTKPHGTVITIENDSALPSTFQSAEFESFVHSRSNRYG